MAQGCRGAPGPTPEHSLSRYLSPGLWWRGQSLVPFAPVLVWLREGRGYKPVRLTYVECHGAGQGGGGWGLVLWSMVACPFRRHLLPAA